MRVVVEITTGVGQLGVGQQPLERPGQRRLAQYPVDLGCGGVASGLQGDVQARDVDRRHAYRFGLDSPGKFREQTLDAARKAGGHRNHRLERRTGTAQVFMVIGVDHWLVVHGRVNGGDLYIVDAKCLIQHPQQRYTAVGGARSIGDQPLSAGQAVLVDAVHHRGIDVSLAGHGLGEQHPWRTGLEKALAIGTGVVGAGTLQDQVHVQGRPVDAFGRGAAHHLHAIAIDVQAIAIDLDLAGKAPMGGVEAGEVFQAGLVGQVVECDDLEIGPAAPLEQRAQNTAADTAITVECNFIGTQVGHSLTR